MKTAGLAVALALCAGPAAAQDAALYPVNDCGKLTTQLDMNICAAANLAAANVVLNKTYQQVMAQQGNAASKAQLKALELVWISYRDKECAFEVGPQKDGGSIWPMEMSMCLERETAARIRELMPLAGCTAGVSACNPR